MASKNVDKPISRKVLERTRKQHKVFKYSTAKRRKYFCENGLGNEAIQLRRPYISKKRITAKTVQIKKKLSKTRIHLHKT